MIELISGQGTQFSWGTASFLLTRVSLQAATGGEIDITSMSSRVRNDEENTGKRFVRRDIDVAFDGEGEVEISVEFLAEKWLNGINPGSIVGLKRDLTLTLPADDQGEGEGLQVASKAVLTQISLGVGTGEFVSGSATFRLSGD
jgi:hypothetical protein